MRGFKTPPCQAVTFTRGDESLTLKVYARPSAAAAFVRAAFPPPEKGSPDAGLYWDRITRIHIALSLKEEEFPPHPKWSDDGAAWASYADRLAAIFEDAGLTEGQLVHLSSVAENLARSTGDLEQAGNGSAPERGSTAA